MQRISLNETDFKKLVRGEIVQQHDLQCALQDIGIGQMILALNDAIVCGEAALGAISLDQDDEEIRRWIHGINQHEPVAPGGFLEAFAATVCRADDSVYTIMRPTIIALKARFPKYRFAGVL